MVVATGLAAEGRRAAADAVRLEFKKKRSRWRALLKTEV
jgi:hypothetical protein